MKLTTRLGLGLLGALLICCLGCEDDPQDLDYLKQHPDAGSDAGAALDAGSDASSDAGTAPLDAGSDAGSATDAGGDDASADAS